MQGNEREREQVQLRHNGEPPETPDNEGLQERERTLGKGRELARVQLRHNGEQPEMPDNERRQAGPGMRGKGPQPPAERVLELQPRTGEAAICRPLGIVPARQRAPGNPGEAAAHSAVAMRPRPGVPVRAVQPAAVGVGVGEVLVAVAGVVAEDAAEVVDVVVVVAVGEIRFEIWNSFLC